ncbi:MAG: Do family serine endopeptidase [Verrucomicrobiota bacterium]
MKTQPLVTLFASAILAGALHAAEKPLPASTAAPLRAFSDAFADVAAHIKPSVVTIFSEKTVKMPRSHPPFGNGMPFQWFYDEDDVPQPRRSGPREYKQTGMGSGMVVDKEGHILTNLHVVDDTDDVKVKFADGTTLAAEIVGTDPRTDIAVLKIKDKLPTDLTPATLGDSEALRVGEWVLAIGAPFGFEQTVTAGIISAKGRSQIDGDRDKYEDFLQTDASINRGNSGGPLVNMRGEIIGINTAIISASGQSAGVGLAIPIDMAKRVLRDLLKSGHVSRGLLGIGIQDLTPALAEQLNIATTKGALVGQVFKDSPAEKAGVKAGDVVVRFNGKAIDDTQNLRNLVAATDPGTKVELIVNRAGKEMKLAATVGELPADGAQPARQRHNDRPSDKTDDYGLTIEPLTDRQARALGFENEEGVLITEVANESPAAEAGLRPGFLIVEVNRQRVANLEDFRTALGKTKDKALLLVKNKDSSRYVVLQTK